MNHEELEGVLFELLADVELADWDESFGAIITRSEREIAHDLLHALERRGYTITRKVSDE